MPTSVKPLRPVHAFVPILEFRDRSQADAEQRIGSECEITQQLAQLDDQATLAKPIFDRPPLRSSRFFIARGGRALGRLDRCRPGSGCIRRVQRMRRRRQSWRDRRARYGSFECNRAARQ
jgi:hypothetical protein